MAQNFVCSKTDPVVETKQGKLRGFLFDETYTFHGIKYADADRFQQPREVEPWDGIKDALSYGYVAPLLSIDKPSGELLVPHRYWPMDEHCQYLNIWTQSLDKDAKKPVMVWLHGGGFFAGSSIEQVAYDGVNLSKHGDVVMVSLNHRLNILGYLDLSAYGEKYRNSCNAGNADMVAALRWVQENIEGFGGDPGNVTIFGQSGGGMKVWTLMQTPEADGLFHKCIIQSGLIDGFVPSEKPDAGKFVEALLAELGFGKDEVEKLETVPFSILAQAHNKVAPALQAQGEYVGSNPIPNEFYLGDPRVIGFTEHAKTIPVLLGSVFGEFAFGPALPNRDALSLEESSAMIREKYGDAADELIALFQKAYPDKHLTDLLFLDSLFRLPGMDFVEKKSAHTQAPTYSYLFSFNFPFDGGHVAWHCSEIPFVFHNTDKVPVCNFPGVSDKLEQQLANAWLAFAKTGNPNTESLPEWPCCKPGDEAVMVFDTESCVKHNFDTELITLLNKVAPPFLIGGGDEDVQIQH